MADYDDTNTGVLFKNQKKETERHPDYTGSINVNGEERWLSAWVKKSKKGTSFMSLSIGDVKGQRKQQERPAYEDPDDDIPF